MLKDEIKTDVVVLIPEEGMFGQVMESGQIKPEGGESRPYPAESLVFIAPDNDGCGNNLGAFIEHNHTLALAIRQLAKFFWDIVVGLCNRNKSCQEEVVALRKKVKGLEQQFDNLQKRFNQHTHKSSNRESTL